MSRILQLENITYGYGVAPVLKNISFAVQAGEFIGIIGPNGAGKSTLLKIINRFLTPQAGRITLAERELRKISLAEISKQVSLVGQDIAVSFALSVLDLVLMGRFPHQPRLQRENSLDLDIVRECLQLTQTAHLADRQFSHLSAGERQRVILAKALAQKPLLLLLDEPTTHLDIGQQIKCFDLLARLNQESGLTILAVLHDLNLASEYCEKLVLLTSGEVVAWGSCAEVLQYPIIEKAYGAVVLVKENPLSRKPLVLPIPGKYIR